MTKRVLSIILAIWFFRLLDHSGVAAASLYLVVVALVCALYDGAALLARKVRGTVPPKGGRA